MSYRSCPRTPPGISTRSRCRRIHFDDSRERERLVQPVRAVVEYQNVPVLSGSGACWPASGGGPSLQTTRPELRAILTIVEMLRKLISRSPSASSTIAFPCVHSARVSCAAVMRYSSGSRCSQARHSQTLRLPLCTRPGNRPRSCHRPRCPGAHLGSSLPRCPGNSEPQSRSTFPLFNSRPS